MSKHDELDLLLASGRLTKEDWDSLKQILDISTEVHPQDRREKFNKEIRHSYGHTIPNLFREWHDPDYKPIVVETAGKLGLKVHPHHTISEIEDKILIEVLDRAKAQIIKEKGPAAWSALEAEIDRDIAELVKQGNLPPGVMEKVASLRGAALMAALLSGRLAGFALYQVASQAFFQIAKLMGLRIGVAVAGPVIGGTVAFLLGPAGWLLAGLTLAYDLGNTNWKTTISAVVMVAILRRKYEFA